MSTELKKVTIRVKIEGAMVHPALRSMLPAFLHAQFRDRLIPGEYCDIKVVFEDENRGLNGLQGCSF